MIDALKYEYVRLRTLRSTYWVSAIAIVLSLLIAVGIAFAVSSVTDDPGFVEGESLSTTFVSAGASVGVPFLFAYLMAIIGVFAWGHEYRHGMIRATLTAQSSRVAAWAAKFLVVAGWIAVCWLLTAVLSVGLSALIVGGSVEVVSGDTWLTMLRCLVYAVVLAWLAMGFAALVRHQVLALVLLFAWPFLIEEIIRVVLFIVPSIGEKATDITKFLPFNAGKSIVADTIEGSQSMTLDPWAGFGVFGGLAVVLMIASLVIFQRRDA